MHEAYAAMLVGIVSAAAAIGALLGSRHLPPLAYTAVHLTASLLMIMLVTFGYEAVPAPVRIGPEYVSRPRWDQARRRPGASISPRDR